MRTWLILLSWGLAWSVLVTPVLTISGYIGTPSSKQWAAERIIFLVKIVPEHANTKVSNPSESFLMAPTAASQGAMISLLSLTPSLIANKRVELATLALAHCVKSLVETKFSIRK